MQHALPSANFLVIKLTASILFLTPNVRPIHGQDEGPTQGPSSGPCSGRTFDQNNKIDAVKALSLEILQRGAHAGCPPLCKISSDKAFTSSILLF